MIQTQKQCDKPLSQKYTTHISGDFALVRICIFQLCFCNCAILDIPGYAFFQQNTISEKESAYDCNSLTYLIEKKGKYSALNVTSLK